jgi:hypothetical protein
MHRKVKSDLPVIWVSWRVQHSSAMMPNYIR